LGSTHNIRNSFKHSSFNENYHEIDIFKILAYGNFNWGINPIFLIHPNSMDEFVGVLLR